VAALSRSSQYAVTIISLNTVRVCTGEIPIPEGDSRLDTIDLQFEKRFPFSVARKYLKVSTVVINIDVKHGMT
jgi:hypothetical protein